MIRPEAGYPAGRNLVLTGRGDGRRPVRRRSKSGGQAIFRAGQQFQFGLMSQTFIGIVVAIQLNDVHVVEEREFAVDGSDVLAVFEADRLTF